MSSEPEPDWFAGLPSDTAAHVRKLQCLPDFPRQLARFSSVLAGNNSGSRQVARQLAEHARRAAPNDLAVRRDTDWYFEKVVPRWHYRIINDPVRNDTYRRALERHVKPGMIVYEIGTGTGILAMLAARAGAKHVYACERKALLAEVARENIEHNGLSDRITVLSKDSQDVRVGEDLPERADLMVCEIVNNGLLGEYALDLTQDALERLLKPDAILLPDQIELRGTLIEGNRWTAGGQAAPACGLNVSSLNWLGPAMTEAPRDLDPDIAEDVTLLHFDMRQSSAYLSSRKEIEIKVNRAACVDGLVHWIWLRFGEGLELENRPPTQSCWSPKVHLFPEIMDVEADEQVGITVSHDRKSVEIEPLGQAIGVHPQSGTSED